MSNYLAIVMSYYEIVQWKTFNRDASGVRILSRLTKGFCM